VALDLILTGRSVSAEEALKIGLVNRVVEKGQALPTARELAHTIAGFPQSGLRGDRMSAFEQWSLPWEQARRNEVRRGLEVLASGESVKGAARFASGAGRHGSFTQNTPDS
jgi:enoyl-CoA hydratase